MGERGGAQRYKTQPPASWSKGARPPMSQQRHVYGVSREMLAINYLTLAGIVIECIIVYMMFGTYGGLAVQSYQFRAHYWTWWWIFTQGVGVFSVAAMLWLLDRNFSGWRYWMQAGICGGAAAWNGVGTVLFGIAYNSCDKYSYCLGQSPIGFPWIDSPSDGSVDPFMIAAWVETGASCVVQILFVLLGWWLRSKVEVRMLAMHRFGATSEQDPLIASKAAYRVAPGSVPTMQCIEMAIEPYTAPVAACLDGQDASGFHFPVQSHYLVNKAEMRGWFIEPARVAEVASMVEELQAASWAVVPGPHVDLVSAGWVARLLTGPPEIPVLNTLAMNGGGVDMEMRPRRMATGV